MWLQQGVRNGLMYPRVVVDSGTRLKYEAPHIVLGGGVTTYPQQQLSGPATPDLDEYR